MSDTNDLYGWYDSADQLATEPTYDPPHDAPCPYCGRELIKNDVRTHNVMAQRGATRCYFYRTHRTCDDDASEGQRESVFHAVLNRIAHDGEPM